MRLAALERDLAIVACAISAGVHAALAPAHLAEGTGIGVGFLVAAAALAGLAASLTRSADPTALAATAVTLTGLIASYALAITSGLPLLHPDPEAVDGLAVATKLVEGIGLAAALDLLRHSNPTPKGQLTCARTLLARSRSGWSC